VRVSIERGRLFGGDEWVRQTVKDLGLEHTVRLEGRPTNHHTGRATIATASRSHRTVNLKRSNRRTKTTCRLAS
jgi:hypothetical protein